MLGYQPPLFPWSGEPSNVPSVEDWSRRSQEVWERAHVRLQRAVRRQKIQANLRRRPHTAYEVGQRVWLSTKNLKLKLPCKKLSPSFVSPFKIIQQINPVSYHLELPPSYSISPIFYASLLEPYHGTTSSASTTLEPPPSPGHRWHPSLPGSYHLELTSQGKSATISCGLGGLRP